MRRRMLAWAMVVSSVSLLLGSLVMPVNAEDLTFTTYYPAPASSGGSSGPVAATKGAIGTTYKNSATLNALADNNFLVEGSVGLGTTDVSSGKLTIASSRAGANSYSAAIFATATGAGPGQFNIPITAIASGNGQNIAGQFLANAGDSGGTGMFSGVNDASATQSPGTMVGAQVNVMHLKTYPITSGMTGLQASLYRGGSGLVGSEYGISVTRGGGGPATNAYGISIGNQQGTATNNYGLYIDTQTGATNNYAIYAAGGQSYFGGNVGIGAVALTPSTALDLSGVMTLRGMTPAPAVSPANQARLYADTTGTVQLSQNGGAYQPLVNPNAGPQPMSAGAPTLLSPTYNVGAPWYTVNFAASVPTGTRAVVLQFGGPGQPAGTGADLVFLDIRANDTSATLSVYYGPRSSTNMTQIIGFLDPTTRTLQYQYRLLKQTGSPATTLANDQITLRLVGYF